MLTFIRCDKPHFTCSLRVISAICMPCHIPTMLCMVHKQPVILSDVADSPSAVLIDITAEVLAVIADPSFRRLLLLAISQHLERHSFRCRRTIRFSLLRSFRVRSFSRIQTTSPLIHDRKLAQDGTFLHDFLTHPALVFRQLVQETLFQD